MGAILDNIEKKLRALSEPSMRQLGAAAVQYAQSLVPVRTGALKRAIRYEYNAGTHTLSLIADSPYGLFVEFGTYKMAARPYIRPALEKTAAALAQVLSGRGENLAMDFRNVTAIKHPEVLAYPRNARHAAIMKRNRATSVLFNRGRAGHAGQFISHGPRRGR